MRLDRLLVEKGLLESREKAQRAIMAGDVLVDGQRVDKAGALISSEAEIEIRGRSPYVSRGGEKLAHALEHFQVKTEGRICIDIGASTGGFTEASRTACSSAEPAWCTPWTSAPGSWTPSCARTRASW
jgi:23S rRNA (cytidine1920-2'-O)/16S rRNA (cytidine1409-2'-O)-methyltransferase